MVEIALALVPVFLVIGLGIFLRIIAFPGDHLWQPLERLTYFVLFPPLLFHTIVTADMSGDAVLPLAATFLIAVVSMGLLLALLKPILPVSGPEFTSVFQGAVRWNGFVALGVVSLLYGPPGVALAAVAFATMVPTVNLMSVVVLTRYASGTAAGFKPALMAIVTNPLILACIAGIAVKSTGITLPQPILATLKMLADATLALGLLAVGVALDLRAHAQKRFPLVFTTVLKLGLMPVLMLGACWLTGTTGLARDVALICACVPGATSSYILARQLGGDATLMANLITVSTLLSIFTLPLWVLAMAP
ncbi:MAG TPA: AEC family transporter [Micropepsaceae bacterium]|nr:AEC family transporter [Micropepsaceae bacterium]